MSLSIFRKTFSIGGIHPPTHKDADPTLHLLPLPTTVVLPLHQHIGSDARPIVAKGDHVVRGQVVAEHPRLISADVHSPLTGTVTAITTATMADGRPATAITVSSSPQEHEQDTQARQDYWQRILSANPDYTIIENTPRDAIIEKVTRAGIVGLGGATFPSHVKLDPGTRHPDTLIINGCECEPYLMCDDALMRACAHRIVAGAAIMAKAAGTRRVVLATEENKPQAAEALGRAIADSGLRGVSVCVLRTRYPQGGEKQLVQAVTGRHIPSRKIPADVGVVVHNVATAFAIWQAVECGEPLMERVVTVTGDVSAAERRNYITAIGTPLSSLPMTLPAAPRIILGGPMMGRTAVCTDAPVCKGTSGITVLAGAHRQAPEPCLRCGRCVDVCPMGLEPYLIATYGRLHRWDDAAAALAQECIECGSCTYTCPSHRPILDFIRLAKKRLSSMPK